MEDLSPADVKNAYIDGVFATIFGTLTGGVFLTGFAIYLGMTEFQIGLLAAMPYAATLFQPPASIWIGRTGKRKRVAVVNNGAARLVWLLILATALTPLFPAATKIPMVMGLVFVSHSFLSVSYVSWLSWLSDLVPDQMFGRFFGTRNMFNGIAGMASVFLFGHLLEYIADRFPNGHPVGFGIVFVFGVACGMASLAFLSRVSEPPVQPQGPGMRFADLLKPFRDANIRCFLLYALLWNFSVFFAAHFFALYFLRDLGFSYGFVATLGMISAIADLTAMRIWGTLSDRFRNKAVIQACSWIVALAPFLWTFVRPRDVWLPVLLHIAGGGFWAGIQLCTNNLVLRISPKRERAVCISLHNIVAGVGATTAPVLAGLALEFLGSPHSRFLPENMVPLQAVFLCSSAMRILSLQFLRRVHEPEEVPVGQIIRILRNVRGLNTTNGFNGPLHPFVEGPKAKRDESKGAR